MRSIRRPHHAAQFGQRVGGPRQMLEQRVGEGDVHTRVRQRQVVHGRGQEVHSRQMLGGGARERDLPRLGVDAEHPGGRPQPDGDRTGSATDVEDAGVRGQQGQDELSTVRGTAPGHHRNRVPRIARRITL